ncbi:hypothetical protein [Lentzea indica]|uniref:hypothetical protein n=1 Tax=Lentzea indica TaxID=2604800 RepID=UPI0014389B34|nr:hypothetical protein [Lentzea indica]
MTTAVRLPDQFSPGAAAANAATPTCCCCCCCCAVSSVGAAVHIPAALHQDTKELPKPRGALVLPAAIFPLLVVVLPFVTMGEIFDLHWGWWAGGFLDAVGWAVAAGFIAKSPKPWMSVVRLLGWALLWCVEPFVVLLLLGPIATATHVAVVGAVYIGGALAFGYWLFRHYRSKK